MKKEKLTGNVVNSDTVYIMSNALSYECAYMLMYYSDVSIRRDEKIQKILDFQIETSIEG